MGKSGGLSTELKQKIGGTKVAVIGSMAVDLIAEVPTVTPCTVAEHSVIYYIAVYLSRQIYIKSRTNAPYRIGFSCFNDLST